MTSSNTAKDKRNKSIIATMNDNNRRQIMEELLSHKYNVSYTTKGKLNIELRTKYE